MSLIVFILVTLQTQTVSADGLRCQAIFVTDHHQFLETFKKGAKDFFPARNLAQKILKESASKREQSLRNLGANYRAVPKKDPHPTAAWHIGGRRLLDYALTLIERWDLQFARMTEGTNGAKAYAQFITRQQNLFGTKYDAEAVLSIANYLKTEAARLQQEIGGPEIRILLGGSFINGKGHLETSDLDITVNTPQLIHQKERWKASINQLLGKKYPEARLEIEIHGEPAEFYGKINPVVLSVKPDQTSVLVFEPAQISFQHYELKSGPFAEYGL